MAIITEAYNWFMSELFGDAELPTALSQIAPEISALCAVAVVGVLFWISLSAIRRIFRALSGDI